MTVGTYSWHDDLLDVVEDTLPVLRVWRGSVREKLLHVTRLYIWNHPPLPDGAQVLCDVVHQLLTWSVTDTVTAGHNTTSQYIQKEPAITSAVVFLGLHFCLFEMKAQSQKLRLDLLCVRGGCSDALCVHWQRSPTYIDPVEEHSLKWWRTVTLTYLSFHHRSHLVASSIDSTCVVNIYCGRDLHVSVMRIDT